MTGALWPSRTLGASTLVVALFINFNTLEKRAASFKPADSRLARKVRKLARKVVESASSNGPQMCWKGGRKLLRVGNLDLSAPGSGLLASRFDEVLEALEITFHSHPHRPNCISYLLDPVLRVEFHL